MWPPHELGQHPTVMDPMERKNVYVGSSTQPFADEGLFARFAGFGLWFMNKVTTI